MAKVKVAVINIQHKRRGGIVTTTFNAKTGKQVSTSWCRSDKAPVNSEIPMPIEKKIKAPIPAKPVKSKKKETTADVMLKFKKEVVKLHSKGTSAKDALLQAAKQFDVELTPSMTAYPGSFVFNYKKSLTKK